MVAYFRHLHIHLAMSKSSLKITLIQLLPASRKLSCYPLRYLNWTKLPVSAHLCQPHIHLCYLDILLFPVIQLSYLDKKNFSTKYLNLTILPVKLLFQLTHLSKTRMSIIMEGNTRYCYADSIWFHIKLSKKEIMKELSRQLVCIFVMIYVI